MKRPVHDFIWDQYVAKRGDAVDFPTLDFGCGNGRLIARAVAAGYSDYYGADTYYGDADRIQHENNQLDAEVRERITLLPAGQKALPFKDGQFAYVYSNQVFEHLADVDGVVDELARITRRGGVQFHAYGTREVVYERHLNIPLIHRIPTARARRLWARPWYMTKHAKYSGENATFREWYDDRMGAFLENDTFYYPWRYFDRSFKRYFDVRHVEGPKLAWHLRRRSGLTKRLASPIERLPEIWATELESRRTNVAVVLTRR